MRSTTRSDTSRMTVDLTALTQRELLALLGDLPEELRRRGLVRSTRKSPTGEVAEALVAAALGTVLPEGRDEGFDVQDDNGSRIQVKACRCEAVDATTQFGDLDLNPANPR